VQLRAGHLRTIGTWRSTGAARMAGQTFRYQHRRSIRQHSGQRHRREQRGGTARWAITFEPEDLRRSGPPSKRAARLRQSRRIPRPEDAGPLPWMPFACPTSTPNRTEAMVEKIDPTRSGSICSTWRRRAPSRQRNPGGSMSKWEFRRRPAKG